MSQDMPEVTDSKVVQTEVDAEIYERFRAAAEAEDLTIKAAVREAIEAFAARHQPIDVDDPLFEPLEWESGEGADDVSDRIDEIVYGTNDDTER